MLHPLLQSCSFPEKTESLHGQNRLLQYDYAFDVSEDSKIDAITMSIGATHPMLNGGSMVTTILESIYAFGSVTAGITLRWTRSNAAESGIFFATCLRKFYFIFVRHPSIITLSSWTILTFSFVF